MTSGEPLSEEGIESIPWLRQEVLDKLREKGILPQMITDVNNQFGETATKLWIKSLLSTGGDIQDIAGPPIDNNFGNWN